MAMRDAMQRPPRMSLTNISNGRTVEMQFNPEQFQENVVANYTDQVVPGLSHEVAQFSHTSSEAFTFDLHYRALSVDEMNSIHLARRFLKSLCFPRGGSETIAGGAPPRVLLVWPRMLSLTCTMRSVQLTHVLFNRQSRSRQFSAAVTLKEVRDFRVTSEEVYEDNQLRYGMEPSLDVDFEEV